MRSWTVEQGDQCAGEQERAGEGDGKAETGRGTEAKRSRGDYDPDHGDGDQDHADDDVDLILWFFCKLLDNRQI